MAIGNTVIIGPYEISLESIDNSVSGQQTWTYKVSIVGTPGPGQGISHWNLELCATHNVLKVSKNGVVVPAADAASLNIVLETPNENNSCYDPPIPPFHIKWDALNNSELFPNEDGTFDFTLEGQFETRDVQLNLKGGVNLPCTSDLILGPSCEPSRGYDFSKLLDIQFITE